MNILNIIELKSIKKGDTMKKTLLVIFFLFFTTQAYALSWEQISSMGNESINPIVRNIDMSGHDMRTYTWITEQPPYHVCFANYSESTSKTDCEIIPNQHREDVQRDIEKRIEFQQNQ